MDRETYLDRVGEDVEPGGREPAPAPLRTVQQFVNTYNHELGSERDRLATPTAASQWLVAHGLLDAGQSVSLDDTRRFTEVREGLRALVAGGGPSDVSRLRIVDHAGSDVRLRVRLDGDAALRLEATGSAVQRVTGSLLATVHQAMIDESWSRLKACRQCGWLFFDHSRNRSGGWCSMAVCGNRAKNRSYRRRTGR